MRMVNSGLRLQFTLRNDPANGLAVEVADEADPAIVLQMVTGFNTPLSEAQFDDECTKWLNARSNQQIAYLRELARRRYRHQHGTYARTTDFGLEAEAKLNEIVHIAGRADVYLGHEPSHQLEGWFVFAPWLRDFTGERFYRKPNLKNAVEFIDLAHAKVTANRQQARDFKLPQSATGADWVASTAADRSGKKLRRVVEVGSIGNGGHVVVWQDSDGDFHATEDYNNVSINQPLEEQQ
jgi:hypothetical protein